MLCFVSAPEFRDLLRVPHPPLSLLLQVGLSIVLLCSRFKFLLFLSFFCFSFIIMIKNDHFWFCSAKFLKYNFGFGPAESNLQRISHGPLVILFALQHYNKKFIFWFTRYTVRPAAVDSLPPPPLLQLCPPPLRPLALRGRVLPNFKCVLYIFLV